MKHSKTEWSARWGSKIPANEQNIVALDIRRPPGHQLVILPDGGADLPLPDDPSGMTAKTRAKLGELHCAAPDCGRFATTVGGASRHHFRHPDHVGQRPGHDPETKEHFAAKHALAQWIRQSAGAHVVRVDVEEFMTRTATSGPAAKPDVYVELDTGAKIAVEYQRSKGDPKDLLRKTETYQDQGVTVWWLYGPGPGTCQVLDKPTVSGITVELTSNQRELARLGVSFFWFDATRARIGTPLAVAQLFIDPRAGELWEEERPRTAGWYARKPFTSRWRTVKLGDCTLQDCEVDVSTGALITPGTRSIARDERRASSEITATRKVARARWAAEQDRARALADRRRAEEAAQAAADAQTAAEDDALAAHAEWAIAQQQERDTEMALAAPQDTGRLGQDELLDEADGDLPVPQETEPLADVTRASASPSTSRAAATAPASAAAGERAPADTNGLRSWLGRARSWFRKTA